MSNTQTSASAKKSRKGLIIGGIIAAVVVVIAGLMGAKLLTDNYGQIKDIDNTNKVQPATPGKQNSLNQTPVDFDALQQQNSDIYGWIYIPDTNINYPVVQSATDNQFYMNHDAKGEESPYGAIFSENANAADFTSNYISILYGHLTDTNQMFSALHKFEDQSYLDEHSEFYVYAPGHIYTYTIASAFITDDTHLMYKYNFFNDAKDLKSFRSMVKRPDALSSVVNASVELTDESRILVLSTCCAQDMGESNRFLVCAVQTGDVEL